MLKTMLSENKYLYNGKELQDEQLGGINLDWLDYGWRMYDPALGRWHVPDPMAQYDSPYTYVGNNPIAYFDPSGMWAEDITKTVVDEEGNIIYHDDSEDKNIYFSPDGKQGADGNTDGLKAIGTEKEGTTYAVGWKLRFTDPTYYEGLNLFVPGSHFTAPNDAPIETVSPELELVEIIFTGGGIFLVKKGTKWLVKKATKEIVEEVIEEAAEQGAKVTIQFGKTQNQIFHAFRHTDDLGLDRGLVQSAVEKHFRSVASGVKPGKPFNQVIEVGGQRIQYTAYQLENGVINIGRIHGVK